VKPSNTYQKNNWFHESGIVKGKSCKIPFFGSGAFYGWRPEWAVRLLDIFVDGKGVTDEVILNEKAGSY
jgi:hypothetical protein